MMNLLYFFFLSFSSATQINLRLILVSGKTKEFLFSPSESAGEIAKIVFEQWPEGEWTQTPDNDKIINHFIVSLQIGSRRQLIKPKY
jgi:hypothetical protein